MYMFGELYFKQLEDIDIKVIGFRIVHKQSTGQSDAHKIRRQLDSCMILGMVMWAVPKFRVPFFGTPKY